MSLRGSGTLLASPALPQEMQEPGLCQDLEVHWIIHVGETLKISASRQGHERSHGFVQLGLENFCGWRCATSGQPALMFEGETFLILFSLNLSHFNLELLPPIFLPCLL